MGLRQLKRPTKHKHRNALISSSKYSKLDPQFWSITRPNKKEEYLIHYEYRWANFLKFIIIVLIKCCALWFDLHNLRMSLILSLYLLFNLRPGSWNRTAINFPNNIFSTFNDKLLYKSVQNYSVAKHQYW